MKSNGQSYLHYLFYPSTHPNCNLEELKGPIKWNCGHQFIHRCLIKSKLVEGLAAGLDPKGQSEDYGGWFLIEMAREEEVSGLD